MRQFKLENESAQGFCKYLNEINKHFKNVQDSDSQYIIRGSNVYVVNPEQTVQVTGKLAISEAFLRNKRKKLEDYPSLLAPLNLIFPISGVKFFQFYRDYKDEIESVIIDNSNKERFVLEISTKSSEIPNYVDSISFKEVEAKLSFYKNFSIHYANLSEWMFDLGYDIYQDIKNAPSYYDIDLPLEGYKDTSLRIHHKYINGITKTSDNTIYVNRSVDSDSNKLYAMIEAKDDLQIVTSHIVFIGV